MKSYDSWITERKSNDGYDGTVEISKDEAVEIIKSLKDYSIDDELRLWRGIELPGTCYMIEPKKDRREYVVGTMPTMVMEYEESWQKFPSRMESLFILNGTEKNNPTSNYGKSYVVIPLDGAEFGVSNTNNYKLSFDKLNDMSSNTQAFFEKMRKAYKDITGGYFEIPVGKDKKNYINDDNYNLLKTEIEEMIMMDDGQYPEFTDFENADELLSYYFNADENGFLVTSYQGLKQLNTNKPVEIWTDSPCLLISIRMFNKIKKEI